MPQKQDLAQTSNLCVTVIDQHKLFAAVAQESSLYLYVDTSALLMMWSAHTKISLRSIPAGSTRAARNNAW